MRIGNWDSSSWLVRLAMTKSNVTLNLAKGLLIRRDASATLHFAQHDVSVILFRHPERNEVEPKGLTNNRLSNKTEMFRLRFAPLNMTTV